MDEEILTRESKAGEELTVDPYDLGIIAGLNIAKDCIMEVINYKECPICMALIIEGNTCPKCLREVG